MGTIVDLTNLVTKLVGSVQDRKFASELREVQRMISSLQSDQASLHEKNMLLSSENAELKQTIASLGLKLQQPQESIAEKGEALSETHKKILALIANETEVTRNDAFQRFGLSKAQGDYHFDKLLQLKYIRITHGQMGVGSFYGATPEGRDFLAREGRL